MPKGIYKRTEEHKKNISKAKKGQNLGRIPWNKGLRGIKTSKKGMINWNKGKILSKEHKRNLSESLKGKIPWNKNKKGLQISWKKGMKFLPEQNPMYGKHHSNKTKRKMSQIRKETKMYVGNKNPNWRGGKSFEPYTKEFNNNFKRLIRKRDNQICMLCNIHREKLNRSLDVHHINYDKKLTIPENCVSLCRNCHMNTNFNRKQWMSFFQSLLSRKYNYQYKENKPIINIRCKDE